MRRTLPLIMLCTTLPACQSFGNLNPPQTLGEKNAGYTYVPLDPLEVSVLSDKLVKGEFPPGTTAKQMQKYRYERCVARSIRDDKKIDADKLDDEWPADVLDALPDHTVRMATRTIGGGGEGGFGPVKVSARGETYEVVVDSVFSDTINVPLGFKVSTGQKMMTLPATIPVGTEIEVVRLGMDPQVDKQYLDAGFEAFRLPVYVGVGLRLTANLLARKGGIELSDLGALGLSADANESSGSLTMQTLGVFNQQVASTYAIPNELSSASVKTALVSLGAVKAIIYDRDTGSRPRFMGIYNPFPSSHPLLINRIYAALASEAIPWAPCSRS